MPDHLPIFDPDTPLETVARTMHGMGVGGCLMAEGTGMRLYSALNLSGLEAQTIGEGSTGGIWVLPDDLPPDGSYLIDVEMVGQTKVGIIDIGRYGGALHLVAGHIAYQCDGPPAHVLFPRDVINDRYCRKHHTVVADL